MRLVRESYRACLLISLAFVAILVPLSATTLAAVPPGVIGFGHGSAEGIDVDLGHSSSGDVDSTSSSNYQVELNFTFSIAKAGEIAGGGSGSYTDAHWHLYGVNGQDGPFDCDPPITTEPFSVDVSGHAAAARRTSRSRCPTPPRRTPITIAGPATPVTPPLRTSCRVHCRSLAATT